MNALPRTLAEERLLDAALQQLLRSTAVGAPPRLRRARFAAAALLGLAVVTGTLVLARQRTVQPAAQDPEPRAPVSLPLPVSTSSLEELDALPVETQNLECKLWSPHELLHLQRLTALRRLMIRKDPFTADGAGPSPPELWRDPKPELLAPLAALPELRELWWPRAMHVQARHVAALAAGPQLQSLTFTEDGVVLGPELIDALAALPRLAELRFQAVRMDSAVVARLARLPLQRLHLIACPGLDDTALAALAKMPTLRGLSVTHRHGGGVGVGRRDGTLDLLTAASIAYFDRMSALRELGLEESELSEELLQLLPKRLEKLDLGNRFVSFGVATALKPMAGLRDLTVGAGLGIEGAERMAALLGTLRLSRLDYRGALTPELLLAVAQQPELALLSLQPRGTDDLGALVQSPRLRELELLHVQDFAGPPSRMTLDFVRPLAGCKPLRHLRLVNFGLGAAEVQALFGAEVQVEIQERY